MTNILQLYPVAWGICEGGNVISPDSEAIFYGILDVFAKPVFTALLLFGHRNIDPARLGLHLRDYNDDPAVHDGIGHKEKHGHVDGHNGVTNGHTNGTNGVTNGTNGVTNNGNAHNGLAVDHQHGVTTGRSGLHAGEEVVPGHNPISQV